MTKKAITKLSKAAKSKIQARYNQRFERFIESTPQALRRYFDRFPKISSTDTKALLQAIMYLNYANRQEFAKQAETKPVELEMVLPEEIKSDNEKSKEENKS